MRRIETQSSTRPLTMLTKAKRQSNERARSASSESEKVNRSKMLAMESALFQKSVDDFWSLQIRDPDLNE